jgi:phage-related protein
MELRVNKEKPVHWVGSAKKDLLALPSEVVSDFGYALGVVQLGVCLPMPSPGRGKALGFELVENLAGDTYRAVYCVRFVEAIYVLHCFQKKSPTGIRTSKLDVELIQARLHAARKDYEEHYGK